MEDCVFCKILEGKIPSNIVYSDDDMIVFENIKKSANIHLLAIPRHHFAFFKEADKNDELVLGKMLTTIAKIAPTLGLENGFRLVVNQGKDSGQEVFHLHIHILGGQQLKEF